MKYIFLGNMYVDVEKDVKEIINPPPVSDHKFQLNLLRGLVDNGQDVVVINVPRVRRFPFYNKRLIKERPFFLDNKILGENLGFVNLFAFNLISEYFALRKALFKQLKENKTEQITLISYNYSIAQNYAMLSVKKRNDIALCGVIGDIHGKYSVFSDQPCNTLKKKIIFHMDLKRDELSSRYDTFGFLTENMADALGVEKSRMLL